MIVMSLLTRFCLFRAPVVFTVENEPKPYKLIPQSSVPMAAAVFLLILIMFITFLAKTGRKGTKISPNQCSFMQFSFILH